MYSTYTLIINYNLFMHVFPRGIGTQLRVRLCRGSIFFPTIEVLLSTVLRSDQWNERITMVGWLVIDLAAFGHPPFGSTL
jgi:hypothetical protein